ncbi:MAG: phage virion morphogenesis protein [Nitrosomonadales bacterium]|nr:phage virion morphogenesis protein [Nitrosomonadales bacterium]
MIKIQVTDTGVVDAFNRLISFGENPRGALMGIGEVVAEFTKRLFEESADPYGTPWAPNSDTVLRAALHRSGRNFTRAGKLSKRGQTVLAGKKPLIGESKSLSTKFAYRVLGNDTVVVTSLKAYAAMQNFGGAKAMFPHLWGDIPARPFFPDKGKGLPLELSQEIAEVLREAIKNTMAG